MFNVSVATQVVRSVALVSAFESRVWSQETSRRRRLLAYRLTLVQSKSAPAGCLPDMRPSAVYSYHRITANIAISTALSLLR